MQNICKFCWFLLVLLHSMPRATVSRGDLTEAHGVAVPPSLDDVKQTISMRILFIIYIYYHIYIMCRYIYIICVYLNRSVWVKWRRPSFQALSLSLTTALVSSVCQVWRWRSDRLLIQLTSLSVTLAWQSASRFVKPSRTTLVWVNASNTRSGECRDGSHYYHYF